MLASTDRRRIGEVRRLDDVLDRLNTAIKGYLTALDPEDLSEADHRRLSQVLVFATNLEAAGDVVDRDVMGHLAKRLKRGAPLGRGGAGRGAAAAGPAGRHGARRGGGVHDRGRPRRPPACRREGGVPRPGGRRDPGAFRRAAGRQGARAVDLDLVRELKRVNGHLVAAAAYPVLEGQGELLASRLRLDS